MKPIYSGNARRTPLVGRRDYLRAVERRICWGGVHLFLVEGEGGMGKTSLLEAILEQNRPTGETDVRFEWCVAHEIIDFQHIDVHSPEGLIRRIIQVLREWCFGETKRALEALERARSLGGAEAVDKHMRAVEAAFLSEFSSRAEQGVVLAFDTIEALHSERDRMHKQGGPDTPLLRVGEWLFRSFLPVLRSNVIILLAGHPGCLQERLEHLSARHPQLEYQHIPLTVLTRDETKDYLKSAARVEASCGNPIAAARLMTFCQARGDVAHFLTGGKPVLLALVADLVAHGWALPPAFGQPLEELQQREAEVWWPEVERALTIHIQDSPTPTGDTLRALAWLPKGATPELLARVMALTMPDGHWDVYTAADYLDRVADLRLVQVRPEDRRVFLHDELQALLESHILRHCKQEERERVYAVIQAYYRDRTRDLTRRLERFPPMSSAMQARWRQARVEEMYYRLRHCPPVGAAMYSWLAEEALAKRDAELELLLRVELLRTLGWLEANDSLAGLNPAEVEMEVALRWGLRLLLLEGNTQGALGLFDQIQERWAESADRLELARVHLQLCQARARIQRAQPADWGAAQDLLRRVEQALDALLHPPRDTLLSPGRRWQVRQLKALALHGQGTLAWYQGRYLAAVQRYQTAAVLQRHLEMSGLTRTLIDLAHAMARTGQIHHGRLLALEAERRCRRRGDAEALARALNVRAVVEGHDNHQREALRYANRALQVAQPLHVEDVHGAIHLTLARARRHLWDSLSDEERSQEPNVLLDALREVDLAVNLLWANPADKVEALLERGCIYGEIARWHDWQGREDQAHRAAARSHKDAEGAAGLAAAFGHPGQQALAWVHLAWLHYYLGQIDQVQAALTQASAAIPPEYLLPAQGAIPLMAQISRPDEACLLLYTALGRGEMLRAYMALDRVQAALDAREQKGTLQAAVGQISLSLYYLGQVAGDHVELARAEEGLHQRILQDGLRPDDLHPCARQAALEHGVARPSRFQEFLNRVFGPADLWPSQQDGIQLRMPVFADLPPTPAPKVALQPTWPAAPATVHDWCL
jgi:hypothetical protein